MLPHPIAVAEESAGQMAGAPENAAVGMSQATGPIVGGSHPGATNLWAFNELLNEWQPVHVVHSGDTLWDLSGRYYGSKTTPGMRAIRDVPQNLLIVGEDARKAIPGDRILIPGLGDRFGGAPPGVDGGDDMLPPIVSDSPPPGWPEGWPWPPGSDTAPPNELPPGPGDDGGGGGVPVSDERPPWWPAEQPWPPVVGAPPQEPPAPPPPGETAPPPGSGPPAVKEESDGFKMTPLTWGLLGGAGLLVVGGGIWAATRRPKRRRNPSRRRTRRARSRRRRR